MIRRLVLAIPPLLLLCGCTSMEIPLGSVLKAGSSAAVGYAAYELAPDDWTNSERAALAAGAAAATWIVGELVEGKISKDRAAAFDAGYSSGRAYGARRQYEIIQQLQKNNNAEGRVKLVALPAPGIPGVNQVPHNVYLEVAE